jgi:hypothetical protein
VSWVNTALSSLLQSISRNSVKAEPSALTKQALYYLSHTSSPFCPGGSHQCLIVSPSLTSGPRFSSSWFPGWKTLAERY